jgi:hypothetical protein
LRLNSTLSEGCHRSVTSSLKFIILMLSGPFMAPVPTPKLNQRAMQLILEAMVLRALNKEQVPELSD